MHGVRRRDRLRSAARDRSRRSSSSGQSRSVRRARTRNRQAGDTAPERSASSSRPSLDECLEAFEIELARARHRSSYPGDRVRMLSRPTPSGAGRRRPGAPSVPSPAAARPRGLDQSVARDDAVCVEQENGEQSALLSRRRRRRAAFVEHFERAEDSKLHALADDANTVLRRTKWALCRALPLAASALRRPHRLSTYRDRTEWSPRTWEER